MPLHVICVYSKMNLLSVHTVQECYGHQDLISAMGKNV